MLIILEFKISNMKTFAQRLYEIGDEAKRYIRNVVKGKIVFLNRSDDDFIGTLLDLPIVTNYDDWGNTTEYGVTSIEPCGSTLNVSGYQRDDPDEEIGIDLECMSAEEVVYLADFIEAHIKETSNITNT